jgi:predicted ATP-grasp superfamily ATP-dependent carboligase
MTDAARVVIAGVSTRAAAESAARAGFRVAAVDAYGDLDQHPAVRALALPRDCGVPFTAMAAARAAQAIEADAVAYLSNFENQPAAVDVLARGRQLWGNAPEALGRARDPWFLEDAWRSRGMSTLALHAGDPVAPGGAGGRGVPSEGEWMLKPRASGGGQRIRRGRPGERVPRGCYLQALADGAAASVVMVAGQGGIVPLGFSRQLVGDSAFGAAPHRYCGNILVPADDVELGARTASKACALARIAAETCGLVGVNGVDVIVRDDVPYPLEVNPRWTASMELVERAYGVSVFGAHAAACTGGRLPAFDLDATRAAVEAVGKAIVFARHDVTVGDTRAWLADATVRDVPHPGTRIAAGQPVCTVFASGADTRACYANLVRRAELVREWLDTHRE